MDITDECLLYPFSDKEQAQRYLIGYMLAKTRRMFEYDGLPEEIDQRQFERFLQSRGNVIFTKHNDKYYILYGGWGGEPNEYYVPTKYIVANPYLKLNKEYTVNEDCVLILNDSGALGLIPLSRRYASQLVENEISLRIRSINSRATSLISAPDRNTKASAEQFISELEKGKLSIIGENPFFEGVKTSPYSESGTERISDLIEYEQYIKSSWFMELGLNSNWNAKRESLNSNETQLNEDTLAPLVDDMLQCRKEACELINKMYGLNVSVKLGGQWARKEEERNNEEDTKRVDSELEDGRSVSDDGNDNGNSISLDE